MIEIILPAMGEGIIEAEVTRWLVREGEPIEQDQPVVEVATDKVDSELPSPGSGNIHKIMIKEGDTAKVGQVMALISTSDEKDIEDEPVENRQTETLAEKRPAATRDLPVEAIPTPQSMLFKDIAFLSPAIRKIATDNDLSPSELMGIKGSGAGGRKTREDVQTYLAGKLPAKQEVAPAGNNTGKEDIGPEIKDPHKQVISSEQIYGGGPSTVEEMDRMRKLIADHMVYSQQVAPHVNSFVESDVTELVQWRSRVKDNFQEKYNQKLTITTLILEAVIKALKEQPRINVSVDGYKIIRKHHINLGMAAAQPDGNLIVPVIHNADSLNLAGLAGKVNDLAERARMNRLLPAEIQGGTFTVTNMGQFGNIAGTPIINQPQVAILAIGAIVKKPAVVETPEGDTIGIRQILVLSLAYDHRVVDGALGGMFLKSIGDHLQGFNPDRDI